MRRSAGSKSREDRQLAKGLRKGKARAWEEFYAHYAAPMYRFTLARVNGNVEMASDIAHEAVVVAMERIKQFDPRKGEMWSWLCGIAINKIRETARRGIRDDRIAQALSDHPGPKIAPPDADTALDVEYVLSHLRPDHQAILEHKYIQGYGVQELAKMLGVSVKAAESRLARARDAFRNEYEKLVNVKTGTDDE